MKKDYLGQFPVVRYSSSGMISNSQMKIYCSRLGGGDKAKYFLLKIEDYLAKTVKKLEVEGWHNLTLYSDCRSKLVDIKKHSSALSKILQSISSNTMLANNDKEWKTYRLLNNGIGAWEYREGRKFGCIPSIYDIAGYLEEISNGAQKAIETIKGKKGVVWNAIDDFLRDVVFAYRHLFKCEPAIYRGAAFVEVVESIIENAGIEKWLGGVTVFKSLKNAASGIRKPFAR